MKRKFAAHSKQWFNDVMTNPGELSPIPEDFSGLYMAIGNFVMEHGSEVSPHCHHKLIVANLKTLPNVVAGRFPPNLEDIEPIFTMHAMQTENPHARRYHLLAGLAFRRYTPPTDPKGHGFRQNEWLVGYELRGTDPYSLDMQVGVSGTRRFSEAVPTIRGEVAPEEVVQRWQADTNTDSRVTRLRKPRGLVEPTPSAGEVQSLTYAMEGALEFLRRKHYEKYRVGNIRAAIAARQQPRSDG